MLKLREHHHLSESACADVIAFTKVLNQQYTSAMKDSVKKLIDVNCCKHSCLQQVYDVIDSAVKYPLLGKDSVYLLKSHISKLSPYVVSCDQYIYMGLHL